MRRTPSPVPGSTDWIEQRRHGIFATDAATVLGINPFASRFEKYAELQGTTMPKVATESMEMGTILQPIVGALWAKKHERKVRSNPWTYWLEDGIGSHFDFDVVPEKGEPVTEIVEVKTSDKFASGEWGEQGSTEVPKAYEAQCSHEMMCRGPQIVRCHLAVLIGGNRYRDYVIERDDEDIANLLTVERRFLANSRAGIAPEMDGSDAAAEYLHRLSPHDDASRWELPESVENLATAYLSALADAVSADEQKKIHGNLLRAAMGDHALATGKTVKVAYKSNRDTDWVDWKAVVMESPDYRDDLIAKFTSTKPGNRPLVVSLIGDA
jgi:putative phage-type endonuclease